MIARDFFKTDERCLYVVRERELPRDMHRNFRLVDKQQRAVGRAEQKIGVKLRKPYLARGQQSERRFLAALVYKFQTDAADNRRFERKFVRKQTDQQFGFFLFFAARVIGLADNRGQSAKFSRVLADLFFAAERRGNIPVAARAFDRSHELSRAFFRFRRVFAWVNRFAVHVKAAVGLFENELFAAVERERELPRGHGKQRFAVAVRYRRYQRKQRAFAEAVRPRKHRYAAVLQPHAVIEPPEQPFYGYFSQHGFLLPFCADNIYSAGNFTTERYSRSDYFAARLRVFRARRVPRRSDDVFRCFPTSRLRAS